MAYNSNESKPLFKTRPAGPLSNSTTDYSDAMANKHGLYVDIYGMHCKARVAFKAFLTNFSDNFDTGLDTTTFIGHPEPVRKIRSVDRQIQIGLDLIAFNDYQAKKNLDDLSLLVKMIYPVIEKTADTNTDRVHVKSGGDPIFKVKFKNLIVGDSVSPTGPAITNGLKGYLGNINYNFDLNAGFVTDPNDEKVFLYPKLISLSFTFYPFNEKAPGWEYKSDGPGKERYVFERTNYPYAYDGDAAGGSFQPSWEVRTSNSVNKVNDAALKNIGIGK